MINKNDKKHLWEVNHPYYWTESNFFQRGDSDYQTNFNYKSFSEFLSDWGGADEDMNLVFRWDWSESTYDDDGELLSTYNGDDNYRNGELKVFFMMQRKGFINTCFIEVCRNDELAVTEYLKPKLDHLKKLWEPLI